MMGNINFKFAIPIVVTASALLPTVLKRSSQTYLYVHNKAAMHIEEFTDKSLSLVGLRRELNDPGGTPTSLIESAAIKHGINPALLDALVHVESGHNPEAVSPKGALGLAQVMPFNAKRCKVTVKELLIPSTNLQCGAQILSEELKTHKEVNKALQAYNGGSRCINRCNESIQYAKRVTERFVNDAAKLPS